LTISTERENAHVNLASKYLSDGDEKSSMLKYRRVLLRHANASKLHSLM